ncbi:MAG TPA: CopG family transcriptional regulator [Actinobacteria bacterium]|nr:CopG family transcriptional regulator [Actinomycetota bacterium]
MKRLQIMIEEDLDEALGLEAKKQGTSKAALIRRFVRGHLGTPDHGNDSLAEMVGVDEFDPAPIDDVVYR